MSGQQVLTLAGQAVGAYFFGPVGAAIGGAIGGYVGGLLFNEDQVFEGQRLSDLKIQTSNYGNAVPIIYGTYRIAGNVIWSTDIREERRETEEGKGGPSATQVDYNYDMDVAIALGETDPDSQFDAIERIYANGVLIYDTRAGASPQNVFASGQWATSTMLYPGTETQLPDPTMEAALGVGNVSAYRGTAYVVITGLQLNVLKTGTLPNFEFVVSTNATAPMGRQITQVSGLTPVYRNILAASAAQPFITKMNETIRVANTADLNVRVYDLDGNLLGTEPRTEEEENFPAFSQTGSEPFAVWNTWDYQDTVAHHGILANALGSPPIGQEALFTISGVNMLVIFDQIGSPVPEQLRGISASVDQRHYLFLTSAIGGYVSEWFLVEWDGTEPQLIDQGTVSAGALLSISNNWNISPVMQSSGAHYMSMLESDLKHVWQINDQAVHVWEIDAAKVLSPIISFNSGTLPLRDLRAAGSNLYSAINADNALASVIASDDDGTQTWLFVFSRLPQVTPAGVTLVDILTDLCERSDLPAAELTFTGISDLVYGFAVGQTMTGRAAIEVLRPAYYFDSVDSDTFKFVKRGAASIVEVAYNDLGAGTESPATEAVSVNRAQETELPARINVRYLSVAADYQTAAQSARRETTGSREVGEINLPIVFDDDNEAAEIADVNLREKWAGAMSRSFVTTIEYAKYEPTDVVRLDDGWAVRTVRVVRKIDKNSLVEWESVDEDVAAYDSNAIGVQVSVPTQNLALQGASSFTVLDIPPLTELSDGSESAAYVAGKGYFSPWPGMAIDVSRNAGTTYAAGSGITLASVMGTASTALSNFLGGNVFDEASTVRVEVGAGTLSSLTHDQVLAGGNYSVIGDEVLQFRTATLVSTGVYDLTGFLRGRKGTEQYISTHAAGDRFVLLSTNLRNLPLQIGDKAITLYVRGTTGSMLPSTGTVRTINPVIGRLMPYSPVQLSATRDSTADWRLTWVRRDRYMNDWNSGVDVPMSEASELYDVEIMSGSEIAETYTDVNDEYLDVDSVVLGPSPTPASITFRVYQKSAIVGRGFVAEKTITQAL